MRLHATESEVQRSILELLTVLRIFAFRINTAAFKVDKRFFRSHSLGPGAADILALPTIEYQVMFADGLTESRFVQPLWIETKKSHGGKQSEDQRSFELHVRHLGHSYLLADSAETVRLWLKDHGAIR